MSKKVLITGATGMIGGLILRMCLECDEVSEIVCLSRRVCGISNPKLKEIIVTDFLNFEECREDFEGVDTVYYCQGVYTGTVSRELFRMVTIDYPVALGKELLKVAPDVRFCLLSSSGADRSERSIAGFAKYKGVVENILSDLGFREFYAFRPAYIYPVVSRKEPNFAYVLLRLLYPLIRMFGKRASVPSVKLAQAMFEVGVKGFEKEILENFDIVDFGSGDKL